MAIELRKAERKKAKARVGLSGPAGSGKTYSSLLIAYGLCHDWSKIAIIDTENHSGELYVNTNYDGVHIGEYNIVLLEPPYEPERYIEAIKVCENAGMSVIIIDSLTHAWAGKGGLLEIQGKAAEKTGNSWTAWRNVTPRHNELVESILQSSCHMICCIRAKMDHVQEKDPQTGKTIIRKVGMGSIQRDGMEYEFTVFFDLDQSHDASSTKDRTHLFDGKYMKPSFKMGEMLLEWLEIGKEESTEDKINRLKGQLNMGDILFDQIKSKYDNDSEKILKALEYIKNNPKPEVKQ